MAVVCTPCAIGQGREKLRIGRTVVGVERYAAARASEPSARGVPTALIDSRRIGYPVQKLAGAVEDGQDVVFAGDKQHVIGGIVLQGMIALYKRSRDRANDLERCRIDHGDSAHGRIVARDILVDVARFGVDLNVFGLVAWQRHDRNLLERRRVDDEDARAVVFIGVDAPEDWVVGDRVDGSVDGDRSQNRLRDRVDFADGAPAAVAGKNVTGLEIDRDALPSVRL